MGFENSHKPDLQKVYLCSSIFELSSIILLQEYSVSWFKEVFFRKSLNSSLKLNQNSNFPLWFFFSVVGFCLLLGILSLCLGTGDICNIVGLVLSSRLFSSALLFGGGRWGGVAVHIAPTTGGALFHSRGIGSVHWELQHFPLLLRTIPQIFLALGISCGLARPPVWLPSLGYQPWGPLSQSHFLLSYGDSPVSLPVISHWGTLDITGPL